MSSQRLTKLDLLDEKSEQTNEFLSNNPGWIIRWGVPSMALIMVALTVLSFVVKYPDKITASIIITTRTPPVSIIAQANGRLSLLVHENESVAVGTVLAIINNSTRLRDLRLVQRQLAAFRLDANPLPPLLVPDTLMLGELQPYYTDFALKYGAYRTFMQLDPLTQEIRYTRAQIQEREQLLHLQEQRGVLLAQEIGITQLDYDRNALLFKQRVIAATSIEAKKRELLQSKGAYQAVKLAIEEINIQITTLRKALSDYRLQYEEKKQGQARTVLEAYKEMASRVAAWQQRYLLITPCAGRVAFFKYWSNNQFVASGSDVFTIVPEGEQEIIGRMTMPALNSAKVRIGQRVIIRLNDYQQSEFGTLTGRVTRISAVPKDQHYAIEVALPQQLTSSYHRHLQFRPEMQGTGDIVTEDLRLIERIYYRFRPVLTQL